jgi:phosphate transport system protein
LEFVSREVHLKADGALKTQAITLMKEDVLSLGRNVNDLVRKVVELLNDNPAVNLADVESLEDQCNAKCVGIEEKCLDLLTEKQDLNPAEVRILLSSTLMAAKWERLADHAHRVAKLVVWFVGAKYPRELGEMASIVNKMIEETLFCFVTDAVEKLPEIVQKQDAEAAQRNAQFLFCARYIERMGDCCVSIAKRTHFMVTGERMKSEG